MTTVLLPEPEPESLSDAFSPPSTLSSGVGVSPSAEGKVLPAVFFMASTLPDATTASMSRKADSDLASAMTASTRATGAASARRVPSQLAFSTTTDTHSTRSILLACGATAAARSLEQCSRRLAGGRHARSAVTASLASTSMTTTSSSTLPTSVAAETSYLSVLVTIALLLGVACSSRRETVPSTPDLTPYSTYTMTCSDREYSEVCTAWPHTCPGLIHSPIFFAVPISSSVPIR
mmetsp:Transcript_28644/g.67854  ORF Transcript_28644/g.67854 Transcript_28644/m.67854 type:complete len:235 (-) Transcript_28644:188-892(-)